MIDVLYSVYINRCKSSEIIRYSRVEGVQDGAGGNDWGGYCFECTLIKTNPLSLSPQEASDNQSGSVYSSRYYSILTLAGAAEKKKIKSQYFGPTNHWRTIDGACGWMLAVMGSKHKILSSMLRLWTPSASFTALLMKSLAICIATHRCLKTGFSCVCNHFTFYVNNDDCLALHWYRYSWEDM